MYRIGFFKISNVLFTLIYGSISQDLPDILYRLPFKSIPSVCICLTTVECTVEIRCSNVGHKNILRN